MDPRVKEYIRKELQRGFSKRSISERLLKAGHDTKVVEQHLLVVMNELEEIDAKLIEDIEKQVKKGLTREQIKQELIKARHSEEKAEKHLWHVFGEIQGVNRELSAYIEKKIDEGSSVGELRGKLIEGKHDREEINRQLRRHKISQYVQVGIALVVVLVLVGSVVLYFFGDRTQQQLDNAWNLYLNGDYVGAIEEFEKVGDVENTYLGLGTSYQKLDEYEKAIGYFEKVVLINPNNADAYSGLGWVYYQQKNYEKAVDVFGKAAELEPDNTLTYKGLAWSYYGLREYKTAIKYFEKALNIGSFVDDEKGLLLHNLGTTYSRAGDYETALNYLEQGLQLRPDDIKLSLQLVWSTYHLHGFDKAAILIDELIRNNPSSCRAHWTKGWMFFLDENYDQSMYYLETSLDTHKCDMDLLTTVEKAEAIESIGRVHFTLENYNTSIEYFKEAIIVDPEYYKSYYGLAFAFSRMGDSEQSLYYFNEGTKRNIEGRQDWNKLSLSEIKP